MKTLNINSKVRIKLTSFGIEILRKQHEERHRSYPFAFPASFTPPAVNEDGFCEMQLWEVMNTFGEFLYNGAPNLPFETNIQIDDEQFEKSEE